MLAFLVSFTVPTFAGAYLPGVKKGDWVFYGDVHWPDTFSLFVPPEPFRSLALTQSSRVEVRDVAWASITARQSWDLLNQTDLKNVTLTTNVQNGAGNLTGWIVAGQLKATDTILGNFYLIQSPTINSTIQIMYWGTTRTVNVLDTTQPYPGYPGVKYHALVYWDSETGFLLEVTLTVYNIYYPSLSFTGWVKITDTSLWANPNRPEFTMSAIPSSLAVSAGTSGAFVLNLTNTGSVSAKINVTVAVSENFTVTPRTQLVQLDPVRSSILLLTVSGARSGDYTVLTVAKSGSVYRRVSVELLVSDFGIVAGTRSFTLEAGSQTAILVTVNSLYGFAGSVRVNDRVSPSGPVVTVQPENLSVGPGGPFTATLTVSVDSSVVPGAYTILVTGTSNSTAHSITLHLMVNPHARASDTILGIPSVEFYSITGVLVAVTAGGAFLTLRRRRYSGPQNMRLQAVLGISSEK